MKNSTRSRRKSSSNFGSFVAALVVCGLVLVAWQNRASWMPKQMPSLFSSSPSAQLMAGGGQVCVYGVKGAIVAGVRVGEDGCAKGVNVAPGRPVLVVVGIKQATVTFKEWGETLPLPGFESQQASASPTPGGSTTTAAASGPAPYPPGSTRASTTTTASGGSPAADGGSTWVAITESLGKVFSGSKVETPSWATAKCPAKTIWIAEDGTITSDVDGYVNGADSYQWQSSGARDLVIAVKGGDGKFHVGTRIAPGVWCTQ